MCFPAMRVGDAHLCKVHGGGVVMLPGAPNVFIGGQFAARAGDPMVCGPGIPGVLAEGSTTVFIAKLCAARVSDRTTHGGDNLMGFPLVLIGGPASLAGMSITLLDDGSVKIGDAITIKGTPEFINKTIGDLSLVASTRSGRTVIDRIQNSGKQLTIIETTDANGYAGPDDFAAATPEGMPVYNGRGNPIKDWKGDQKTGTGEGSDTTLSSNPNFSLPNQQDPANPVPPDGVLFHELNHSSHHMNGQSDMSPKPGWTTNEEHETITEGDPSEADYLEERGYPWKRNSHGTTFQPH